MKKIKTITVPHRFDTISYPKFSYLDLDLTNRNQDGDNDTDFPFPTPIPAEEIGDTPACCVVEKDADPQNIPQADLVPLGATGIDVIKSGQRTIEFKVKMGRPADAAKVKVIQYFKDMKQTNPAGEVNLVETRPDSESWAWGPGADDYIVDSSDNIRCWPDHSIDDGHGVKRDVTTGIVTWKDNPGPKLGFYRQELVNNNWKKVDFPTVWNAEFRTDVLCTDTDICKAESPAVAAAVAAATQNNLVVRFTWKVRWRLRQVQKFPFITPADLTITVLNKQNLNSCH